MGSVPKERDGIVTMTSAQLYFVSTLLMALYFNRVVGQDDEEGYSTVCNATQGEWSEWTQDEGYWQVRTRNSTQRRTDPAKDIGGWKARKYQHSPLLAKIWEDYLKRRLC